MSNKMINIFVNMGMGGRGTSTFQVSPNRLVKDFIQDVIDKEGAEGVRITCFNKQLEPQRNGTDLTLADYGVYNNMTMHAALRLSDEIKVQANCSNATVFDANEVKRLGAEIVCDPSKPNGAQADCIMGCSEGCYESNIPKAKLKCGCIWCADCMRYYVTKEINDNLAIKLSCGNTSHGNTHVDTALAFAIAKFSNEERNEFVNKMASVALAQKQSQEKQNMVRHDDNKTWHDIDDKHVWHDKHYKCHICLKLECTDSIGMNCNY